MLAAKVRRAFVVLGWCLAYGQTVDKSTFAVVSVKPATPPVPDRQGRILVPGPTGGPGTKEPDRINYPDVSLRNLLMRAYDLKSFQIVGPGWLDAERFDVTAKLPPGTTREQLRVMLQSMLSERFKLTIHRETKELPMYALVVAKNGPRMKESAEAPAPADHDDPLPPPTPMRPKFGSDGFPVLAPMAGGRAGMFFVMLPGRTPLIGQQQTMQDLASRLTTQLNRTVADETALRAKYDFILTFSPEEMNLPKPIGLMPAPPPPEGSVPEASQPEGETPPNIFTAVQRGPVEVIVIDHIERTPTEN